jgi:hypothetical protein
MAANNSSLANNSAQQAPGYPNPEDQITAVVDGSPVQVGRPGYLAPGQPGGAGNPDVPAYGGTDVITTGSPAGTAGGGGQYPGAAANPVPNPMIASGWTVQGNTGDEFEQMVVTTASPLPAATHGTAYTETLAVVGGDGSYTWTLESGALPSPCTLSSGGVLSGTPTAAGSATFEVKVSDTHNNVAQKIFTVTVN